MPTTTPSGALPLGTTFASEVARLEATAEGQAILARAQLSEQMLALMRSNDMSGGLAVSILQSRIVEKSMQAGIDVERVLVAMAKATANPRPANGNWEDLLPTIATRGDVAAAIAPYVASIGEKKLSLIFFSNQDVQLSHYVAGKRKPSFGPLCAMMDFLTKGVVHGSPISRWSEDHADYFLAKSRVLGAWDPFDPASDPFPAIQDYVSFKIWFDKWIPATYVQYAAQFTGLTTDLLDRWRRGVSQPSGEMLAKLFSAVREHHPEWLGDGTVGSSASANAAPAVAPATTKKRRARGVLDPQKSDPLAPEPQQAEAQVESGLATAAQEVAELLELLAPKLRLMAQCATQPDSPARERGDEPVPGFTPISEPVPVPEPPTTPVPPQASDDDAIVSGREPVGKQSGRIRFLLTSKSFLPFNGAFTKGEMADTRTLLRELTRRLALVNAKTGDAPAKDAIVNELAADLVALVAQLRGLDFREVANLIGDADMLARET